MADDNNYDEIAEEIFGPIFEIIASDIIEETHIVCGDLLDIGCGGGHLGYAVMKHGDFSTATFLDIKQSALDTAHKRGILAGCADKATYINGNVESLPFNDDEFDLIVSRGSMPFWDNQIIAFREIYRVLKPNGYAYIGGGLGNKTQRERIAKAFATNTKGFKPFDRRNSKTLPNAEYEKLFMELGCEYRIVDDPDKGHWFIFRKCTND